MRQFCVAVYTLIISTLLSTSSFAVEPLFEEKPKDPNEELSFVDQFLKDMGASDHYDNSKKIDFSILPGPFYTPEMELGIGVSAVGLYQVGDDKATENEPSNITVNGFISSNLSAGVTVSNTTLLNGGQQRLEFTGELSSAPDVFYGIGYNEGQRNSNKIDFTNTTVQITPKYSVKIRPNLLAGIGFDYKNVGSDDPEPRNDNDPNTELLTDHQEGGLLFNITYDTRDYLLNPSDGVLLELDMGHYFSGLGDDEFSTYQFNLSNYIDLDPIPGLIAWQVKGKFSEGDVPWSYLPVVGGSSNLRGYISGRYREKQVAYSQVEYRLPISGRSGMVLWVGTASMGNHVSDIGDDFLMSYGTGYRMRIKDRVNLRLDYAIGEHESTVYFNVNEAF